MPTIERASCVTYYDNQLFVGFFNTDGQGQIASYPIARSGNFKGTITSDQIKAVTGQVSWALGSGSASMDRQIQWNLPLSKLDYFKPILWKQGL